MNMPTAAPKPPTQGPKITANAAGIITCGQNLTVPRPGVVIGSMAKNTYPNAAYSAAFKANAAISKAFKR
jgi:hypothetical protein